MRWYDIFAQLYDHSVEQVYRGYRQHVVESLQLRAGDSVLDLACGTGPNHPHLVRAVGPSGHVFGVDASRGMLRRARSRAQRMGWTNVHLIECPAQDLRVGHLTACAPKANHLRGVISTLGLSVIPDWQEVIEHTFSLLAPGGTYVIFDIFTERWVPQTWVVSRLAQADMYRKTWRVLDGLSGAFQFTFLKGSPHIHGGTPFLAVGRKQPDGPASPL